MCTPVPWAVSGPPVTEACLAQTQGCQLCARSKRRSGSPSALGVDRNPLRYETDEVGRHLYLVTGAAVLRRSLHAHILNSSVLPFSSRSVSPQTVPQLTRVTAGGTVMFELESLVIQHFGSRHAYSSWHSIAEFRAGFPTRSPRTNFCWTSWALSFRRENTCELCSLWKLARLRNAQDKSRASHGGDGPPLQGHDGHMPSIWFYSRGVWQIILRPVGHPTALEEIWRGTSPAQP